MPPAELEKIMQKLKEPQNSNIQKIAAALSLEEKARFLGINLNYLDLYTPAQINEAFIKKLHN
jgi:hypothetical protein